MPSLKRILAADDDFFMQRILQIALETLGGFDVVVCGSGREVLEQASAFVPDLLVLDVMMPDLDGIQTMQALRAAQISVAPVVFLTAMARKEKLSEYEQQGVAAVLAKPFEPATLAATLMQIWEGYHGQA